jgi:omega-amidase
VTDRYQKLHLFSPAQENSNFTAGNRIVTFDCGGGIIAPFICYDLRFPEVFREAVEMQAEFFVVIANWPRSREQHWLSLLKARAIENQAFVAGVNRCGKDPNVDYSGRSVIVSPLGEVLADAGEGEAVIEAELDFEAVRKYRCQFPALIDRRRSPASTAESRPEVKKPGSGKLAELQLEQP